MASIFSISPSFSLPSALYFTVCPTLNLSILPSDKNSLNLFSSFMLLKLMPWFNPIGPNTSLEFFHDYKYTKEEQDIPCLVMGRCRVSPALYSYILFRSTIVVCALLSARSYVVGIWPVYGQWRRWDPYQVRTPYAPRHIVGAAPVGTNPHTQLISLRLQHLH